MDRNSYCTILICRRYQYFRRHHNGEFIDEETEKDTAAMLLLDINRDYFQIYFEEYPEKNYREITNAIAQ